MITVENYGTRENYADGTTSVTFEFRGLSTDDKPVEYDGCKVRNGSVYISVDTGTISLFDEASQVWTEVE